LHNILVQEETRLKNQGNPFIHYVNNQGAGKKVYKKHGKGKRPLKINDSSTKLQKKNDKCHFCRKSGHFQKDCLKRKAWFENKGKHNAYYVCFESKLTEVPHNSWWIDSGCTTHVSNMMQGFLSTQTIKQNEKCVFMENREKVLVEVVGTYRLILETGFHLDLSRNLVSLSKLDVVGYFFKFGNGYFSLYKRTCLIGSDTLYDSLYKLNLDNLYVETPMISHHNVGTKRSLVNECSAFLWHKRLRNISKEMMERLVKNEILPNLDFTDLNVCTDCIKDKQTKHTEKGVIRSTELLEIIHTHICGPFDVNSFNKERYFITFIVDFSLYGYVYLLHEKTQAVRPWTFI